MVEIYESLIEEVLNKHAPWKLFKQYDHYQRLTEETKALMKARDNARKSGNSSYKALRNRCTAAVRREIRKAAQELVERDPNHIWKICDGMVKGKRSEKIELIEEGETVEMSSSKMRSFEMSALGLRGTGALHVPGEVARLRLRSV